MWIEKSFIKLKLASQSLLSKLKLKKKCSSFVPKCNFLFEETILEKKNMKALVVVLKLLYLQSLIHYILLCNVFKFIVF